MILYVSDAKNSVSYDSLCDHIVLYAVGLCTCLWGMCSVLPLAIAENETSSSHTEVIWREFQCPSTHSAGLQQPEREQDSTRSDSFSSILPQINK